MVSEEPTGITILNFAHPLTPAQRQQIEEQTGETIGPVIDAPLQLDDAQPFEPQIRRHIDDLALDSDTLQAGGILVNPPGYAPAVAVLLAELHGRSGHFPAIVRIRPVAGSNPTRYEIAEVINLQAIRERSREER